MDSSVLTDCVVTMWSLRGTPPRLSWVLFSRIRREVFPDSVGDGMAVVDWSVGS